MTQDQFSFPVVFEFKPASRIWRLRIVTKAGSVVYFLHSLFSGFFGALIPRGGDFQQRHLLLRRGSFGQATAFVRVLAILFDAFRGAP